MIDHPAIETCDKTCVACPEQYEGTLRDGRSYYFRYRWGSAQLGIGATPDDAVEATVTYPPGGGAHLRVSDSLQGVFDDPRQRDEVFARLYATISA